jgi:UDP-N-acetylglucosamine:LPS N-acetylglucosamine transferase
MQLAALEDAWSGRSRVWVSNDQSDARSVLRNEESHFLPGPYSRDLRSFLNNLVFAVELARTRPPRVLITTGADIAVPLALVARLRGARVVYVESFTRIHTPSLSGRLIALFANRVYVQWPELVPTLRGARFAGAVVEA